MTTTSHQLHQLLFILILSTLIAGCSSENSPKAHTKTLIDVLILDGKVDVSIETNGKVISEFEKVDSFRIETDVQLEAVLSSKSIGDRYLYLVPGIAAQLDKEGVEKIYVTLGPEKEKAASIKKEFDFELKLINRPTSSFLTRYSHYEDLESFYQKADDSGMGRGHVWGNGGVSAFEKRHQEET